jgi:hypothetical protein
VAEKRGSLRCSICGNEWPNAERYQRCPICDEKTWYNKLGYPIDESEASELAGDTPLYPVGQRPLGNVRKDGVDIDRLAEEMRDWLDGASADDFAV